MMTMVDRSQYHMRTQRMPDHMANLEKLTPASLRGAKNAVLEIADAVEVESSRGFDMAGKEVFEPSIVLRFKEFPTRIYWVNVVGVNILCDVLGDDERKWVGKRVPLVVKEGVRNPKTKARNDMLWIASSDDWDSLMQADDDARRESSPKRKA